MIDLMRSAFDVARIAKTFAENGVTHVPPGSLLDVDRNGPDIIEVCIFPYDAHRYPFLYIFIGDDNGEFVTVISDIFPEVNQINTDGIKMRLAFLFAQQKGCIFCAEQNEFSLQAPTTDLRNSNPVEIT